MLENLKIENFRGFESFELQQLGRVNLLVGQNNSGKTSILEAIQLLCSKTKLQSFYGIMSNRGEYSDSDESGSISRPVDIRHLFHGHEIKQDSQFSISGKDGYIWEKLVVLIEVDQNYNSEKKISNNIYSDELNKEKDNEALKPNITWFNTTEQKNHDNQKDLLEIKPTKTQFVTPFSLNSSEMVRIFEKFVLKPEEKVIEEAVRIIEPSIERIAAVSSTIVSNRGGFAILRSDNHQRVPIGSLGDGTWRMLGLALAIVNVKDGVLLVDEIDTGLHFTAMSKMWKLIWETAKRLNVQVFATTHNSDCWKSLASIACQENAHEEGGITIQRIEPDKNTAIAFNEREIVIAAERDLEVR
jgi:AAA15 family ATPase/GTPase